MAELGAHLADFIAGLDVLPEAADRAVREDTLDTLGCALAGRTAPGVRELTDVLAGWGGANEATVWGTELRLPAPAAALINGTAGHALEFDDTHDEAVLHAGVTVLPAALAAAQRAGTTTWAELSPAIAAGLEVACRIGVATTRGPSESGWLLTPLCGTFGAAASAARALRLDADRTLHALGIAYAQAAGNGQATLDRALTKRMQAGFAAQAGVLAAVLAEAGVTGATRPFEGPRGYFGVYHGGAYDRDRALDGLGERFLLEGLAFKPYPCCRWTHAAIDAALRLPAADVERARVYVSRQAFASTGTRPAGTADAPGVVSAQFSIPYAVATALRHGPPRLEHFTVRAVSDPVTLALAARIEAHVDSDPGRAALRGISAARIDLFTEAGERHSAEVRSPARADLRRKFLDCCAFAGEPQAAALVDELLEASDPDLERTALR